MTYTLIHPDTSARLTVSSERVDADAAPDRSALVPWRAEAELRPVSRNRERDADGRPYLTAALEVAQARLDARAAGVVEADGGLFGGGDVLLQRTLKEGTVSNGRLL